MTDEELVETPQRWTARRRAALVLSLLRGETSAAEAARKHGLTVAQVQQWRKPCASAWFAPFTGWCSCVALGPEALS